MTSDVKIESSLDKPVLQRSIDQRDNFLATCCQYVGFLVGDHNGMKHTGQRHCGGFGGAAAVRDVVYALRHSVLDDFGDIGHQHFAIAMPAFQLLIGRQQHHFKDEGTLLEIVKMAVHELLDQVQEPFRRLLAFVWSRQPADHFFDVAGGYGIDEAGLGMKMLENIGWRHAEGYRYVSDRHVGISLLAEQIFRRVEDILARFLGGASGSARHFRFAIAIPAIAGE